MNKPLSIIGSRWSVVEGRGRGTGELTTDNPPLATAVVPDIAIIVGFLWAGLMFASAAVNVFVARNYAVVTWAWFMPVFGIVSKIALLLIGFGMMRVIGRRRYAAMPDSEREKLTAAA